MIFSFVSETTGQLLSTGNFPDAAHVAANTPAGALAIEGAPPGYDFYYASDSWVQFPQQPEAAFSWDPTGRQWIDPRSLAQAQSDQLAELTAAYESAIAQPVAFTTAAGVTQTFQADPQSVSNAVASMLGCQAIGATPSGFYWVSEDNTQVPFTYADLQGLAAALFRQGQAAFVKLQMLKSQVRTATTVSQVTSISWS